MNNFSQICITLGLYEIGKSCITLLMIILTVYVMNLRSLRFLWSLLLLMIILKVIFRFDMCVNGRFITNKYTGSVFWSKCGKCPSCLQEKAAMRSARIRSEYSEKVKVFFVELDYNRYSCPYFTQKDYDNLFLEVNRSNYVNMLPIYRDHSVRWDIHSQSYKHTFSRNLLYNHVLDDNDFLYDPKKYHFCHWLVKQPYKIGVPYFKDIQDFEKRFRIWLVRKLHYNEKVRFFNVNELGGKHKRPHFHFLLFAPGLTEAEVREAVCQTWPFSDRARYEKKRVLEGKKPKVVQLVEDDPAGYVSSYVNCTTSVSPFLARYFKCAKHSASKYFGHGRESFSLEAIKKKITQRDLSYDVERTRNGVREVVNLPIPKYVINRYFPLFKGYSRFTDPQVREFLSNGFDVGYLLKESLKYDSRAFFPINYNLDKYVDISTDSHVSKFGFVRGDLSRIRTRLLHAFEFYRQVYPYASFVDYADSYVSAWNLYKSCSYQRFVNDKAVSDFYKYDNICLYPPDRQQELHRQLDPHCVFIVDNNQKPHYRSQTEKMTDMFYKYDKQRKVSDTIRDYNECIV